MSHGFQLRRVLSITQNINTMNSKGSPVMWPLQPTGTRDYFLGEQLLRLELPTIKQCGG
jgi:hypothetical protein